ncbi:MAG: ABC-F family ATP-binding cassette domain-containing protein [Bacteroidaceae bacterium]|nr:ABC-F family ATP-binding cassette domain-containing protein [Bacteroidaceae bacterium]
MTIPYLDIQNLTKRIGDLVLFENISFSLAEGERVGIIARNGAGKSTLLNVISGKEDYESGEIIFRNNLRIGYLEQTPKFNPEDTVLTAVSQFSESILGGTDYTDEDASHISAKQILTKLQITEFDKPVGLLSGGQLKRVALARVLLSNPDLLILDEPTNHLDLEMIEWLEGYLRRNVRSLLMVTHDRYFLDRVCNEILEIEDKTIYSYQGNYAYYLEKRDERIAVTNANIQRANNLYRRELEWMRRTPSARTGKSRSRKEAFYELEQQARRRQQERTARLDIKSGYIGSKIFEAEYVSKAYPSVKILDKFYYNFSRYEKMGIIGNNGTGKTTFLKLLLGMERPDEGRFVVGETVRFGYFSQAGMEFDNQMKVIDAVRKYAETIDLGGGRTLTAMQFLNHFLFPPSRQQDYVYKLSGGERRRLYLCTVLMQNPNFLILDEPTNDLDIATLNVLEDYLADFRGCVIIVSHDRYFMDKVVDHLLVFKGNAEIDDFPGNYTQYREMPKEDPSEKKTEKGKPDEPTTTKVTLRKPKLSFKEKQELAQLEQEIEQLEEEKKQIETALCSGNLSAEELTKLSKRLPELNDIIDTKTLRWMELEAVENG